MPPTSSKGDDGVQYISGTSTSLAAEVLIGLARFRHRVFVEMLGWELQTRDGLELDQFDRADTVYVAARNEHGAVVGIARLLPTTRPYLLRDVFPQLLHEQPLPCTTAVWELSRFAAVDFDSTRTTPVSHVSRSAAQVSSPVAVGLLREAMRVASDFGAQRLITVSPLGVERLLRKAGFRAHRAGPPIIVEGHPVFACWIDLESPAGVVTH
jgi:acyl homoserine lactone synthase